MGETSNEDITTDEGELQVLLVGGPHPYVWIGTHNDRYLDSFSLEGSPLTCRRKAAIMREEAVEG